ncbi:hypothetical protein [Pseudofrankia sp. BMG5.37]|uniref:hypothetical protein n=1 Tax=Pseudofrankia sp. BMG5.37 TaxID=3050035 RepID=UPI0028951461|nr:hypothetical protein [Pseudofrankia sp. BMG5.37]MDT3438333.1 hypothetical protein [Pseudofrankia sp. BMG5.37]
MTSIRMDLGRLPWPVALGLVLLAGVVLALRVAGLAVCLIVDGFMRLELAVSAAAGIAPLGGSSWPLDATGGSW